MKNVRKLTVLALIVSCASCSTTKHTQVQPDVSSKSYKLPAIHMEMHKQLLEQQKYRMLYEEI